MTVYKIYLKSFILELSVVHPFHLFIFTLAAPRVGTPTAIEDAGLDDHPLEDPIEDPSKCKFSLTFYFK